MMADQLRLSVGRPSSDIVGRTIGIDISLQ